MPDFAIVALAKKSVWARDGAVLSIPVSVISVLSGAIYDVAVDIRTGSATYGEWVGVHLRADEHRQLWVPPGFAHGFCVTEGPAAVHYRCTTVYAPEAQGGIRWDDPDLGIQWPVVDPILSDRDQELPYLND
mgnify:CR=1 FL=1